MDKTSLGDRMKFYMARLDGRCFSKFNGEQPIE